MTLPTRVLSEFQSILGLTDPVLDNLRSSSEESHSLPTTCSITRSSTSDPMSIWNRRTKPVSPSCPKARLLHLPYQSLPILPHPPPTRLIHYTRPAWKSKSSHTRQSTRPFHPTSIRLQSPLPDDMAAEVPILPIRPPK